VETVPLPRGRTFKDYTVKIPGALLRQGENTISFRARYVSRRRRQAVRVSRLRLEGIKTASSVTPLLAGEPAAFLQAANTRVCWRLVVPRGGYLKVQPHVAAAPTGLRGDVFLRLRDKRFPLASFTASSDRPETVSLARWGGERATLEFETFGSGRLTWKRPVVGGLVEPRDVNVYVFTVDTLRHDHVGAYGYGRETTPAFDRLAARGILFLNAYACSNLSGPSHASILTGRYPQSHGIVVNGSVMHRQQTTLADILGKKGYRTAAYVSFDLLQTPDRTGKGFEASILCRGKPQPVDFSTDRSSVYVRSLEWAERHWHDRQFLWVHSEFLHMLDIPKPYSVMFWEADIAEARAKVDKHFFPLLTSGQSRKVRSGYNRGQIDLSPEEIEAVVAYYDGALRLSDDYLDAFTKALPHYGLDPFTALVVTSDHGVSLGECHRVSHVGPPYEHLLHVPLLFVLPGSGLKPGLLVEGLTDSVDIAPTLLAYLGQRVPRRMQGINLIPGLLDSGQWALKPYACAMLGQPKGRWYAIRSATWRFFINEAGDEFLEPANPPRGTPESALDAQPAAAAELRKKLMHWIKTTPDVTSSGTEELSAEVREMLRKAGYLDDSQ